MAEKDTAWIAVPSRSVLAGLLAVLASWPLRAVVLLAFLARHLHNRLENGGTWGIAILVAAVALPVPLYYLAAWVRLSGRRRLAAAGSLPVLPPGRDHVLYLRSFDDDERMTRLAPALRTVLSGPGRSPLTEEEQLAAAVRPLGRLIAIGRPREARPPSPRPQRMYVPDARWRDTVLSLMDDARLVLLAVGEGAGLRWELEQALDRLPPERLMLLVPHDARAYTELAAELETGRGLLRLPVHVPVPRRREHVMSFSGAVFFDRSGEGRFVPFVSRWPHVGKPLKHALISALLKHDDAVGLSAESRRGGGPGTAGQGSSGGSCAEPGPDRGEGRPVP